MDRHFGRHSTIIQTSGVFEGGMEGEVGDMSPIQGEFDDMDMGSGGDDDGLAMDEEMMMGGGKKGNRDAEDEITKQIINN